MNITYHYLIMLKAILKICNGKFITLAISNTRWKHQLIAFYEDSICILKKQLCHLKITVFSPGINNIINNV